MDLRALKYLVHAVEAGSITAAAEQCHIAQPSITNAIAQLEQEFETTFLIRSRKGVTTTEAGSRFYQKARSLLQHADLIKSDMQQTPKDTLNLFVSPSVNAYALKVSMQKLQQLHPTVHWILTADASQASHQLISMQQLSDNQQWLELIQEEYYLLIPSGHDVAQKHQLNQTIQLEDLIQLPWIERSHCEFVEEFNLLISESSHSIDLTAQVENEDWAISLVAAGMGATVGPITPQQLDKDVYGIPLKDIQGAPPLTRILGLASDPSMQST